ncbi:MAG: gliding motility-associated C-terminal domain-containing protein [Chitinophagales bacterium]
MKNLISIVFAALFFFSQAQTTLLNQPIINTYAAVVDIDFCKNAMQVANNAENNFNVGDKVLIVQMKGAIIREETVPFQDYGNVENYVSAGAYEYNVIKSINLGSINGLQFEYELSNNYRVPGKVQIISVPQYVDVDIQTTLTALPWDGSIGGIILFEASGNVNLQANIFADEIGFRGGAYTDDVDCFSPFGGYNGFSCTGINCGGIKGEGIGFAYEAQLTARGKDANGGGGGNDHNAGGGGGANGGAGGDGGDNDLGTQFCNGSGGQGGQANVLSLANNRILMGGAGGAGDSNNETGTAGGNAGGCIIIKANSLTCNGFLISANGAGAAASNADGPGGGGAGGTIILDIATYNDPLNIEIDGGKGGDNNDTGNCPGVGGGGSGGSLWLSQASAPANINLSALGGVQGIYTSTLCTGLQLGVEDGEDGGFSFNYAPIISSEPFIETTVSAEMDALICAGDQVNLSASISSSAAYEFNWIYNGVSVSQDLNTTQSPVIRGVNEFVATATWNVFSEACIEDASLAIIVRNPDITIVVDPDEAVEIGDVVFLNAVINPPSQNYTYQWSENYVQPQDDRNALVEPFETTEFCISVTDEIGCVKTACTTIEVLLPNSGAPDAFSPNGDNLNDVFRIIPEAQLIQKSLKIYDRWGELLYESTELLEWDGKLKGVLQNADNYIWTAEFEHRNTGEKSTQSGNITLIR